MFEVNFPKIEFNAAEFEKSLNLPKLMQEEILLTRTRIAADTTAGRKANGGGFRAYSKGYALLKAAAGRGTRVNLTWTQKLLLSMVPTAIQNGFSLGFQGDHGKNEAVSQETKAKLAKRSEKKKQGRAYLKAAGLKTAKKAKAAKTFGSKPLKGAKAKSKGGGGSTLSNAALAASLYARGFVGWFTFGKTDLDRIEKRLSTEVQKNLKSLIEIK